MANKDEYPFKLNGYIYSPGTASGFQRMKRLGIPRPLFRLENKMTKLLKNHYRELVRRLLQEIKEATVQTHAVMDQAPLTQDSLDDLLDFFEEMGKQEHDVNNRANFGAAANTLANKWLGKEEPYPAEVSDEFIEAVDRVFKENQSDFQHKLFQDADQHTATVLASFSLDKQKVYQDRMDMLRHLYLDDSLDRISWEEDVIKRTILKRILRYVNGETPKLKLEDLTNLAYSRGDNLARLFARDQMARFNKATTLATFQSASVTKVKWVTSHDIRVRDTHKALDGHVFDINDLPPEIDDYNCRCGLVPVEWSD